ncbi:unnamed protein product [Penicillium camemberti]|uniref:Str. FM013 n=1 Tax=Penicillium camemberti (strain FM 013) TaxID=1429867 RepID=A0A0G4PPQ0_PENC3|nr:unnamed protein product [Penicillium camemberti]
MDGSTGGATAIKKMASSKYRSISDLVESFKSSWNNKLVTRQSSEYTTEETEEIEKCIELICCLDGPEWHTWRSNFDALVSKTANPIDLYQFDRICGELNREEKALNGKKKATKANATTSKATNNDDSSETTLVTNANSKDILTISF